MLNKERRAILEEYGASIEVLEEPATEGALEEAAGEMTAEEFKEWYAPHLAPPEEIAVEDVEGITKEARLDAVGEVEEEMEAEAATEQIAADETHGAIEDEAKVLTEQQGEADVEAATEETAAKETHEVIEQVADEESSKETVSQKKAK